MANYGIFFLIFASVLFNEIELNEAQCNSSPCQNAGDCILLSGGGFQCICQLPWNGKTCTDICPDCLDPKCPANTNTGQCSIQCLSSITCSEDRICCADGNCGTTCFSACDSNPCKNGGGCLTRAEGTFQCDCPAGFTGTTCEEPVDPVTDPRCIAPPAASGCEIQCVENGDCESSELCCPGGACGTVCLEFDPCDPSPCQHDGICVADGRDFTCKCKLGFTGAFCQLGNTIW
ncbi:protein lin-12-like [Styela clava]